MTNPISGSAWQFARANLAYLLSGKLRSKKGYQPTCGHEVPLDFAGIGIATTQDPAIDEVVIGYLHQLGIRQVRIDFTYGDTENHVARFLEKLIANNFKVMLHIVQPFHAAKNMQQAPAQQEWKNFITKTLEHFGDKIEILEIGSTINRKRWAGYTLDGFLTAWDTAYREAKSRHIKLAGPNITDFEPLYNIGILAILEKRGQLPDIHTDNLFSERCTEPERDDHKILGHRLAKFGGFRLVKKAFMLQEIGEYFGVPAFHSPSAFWTLPRIHRLLPDGEQKQADYLARYMLLCAASGALQRASWGPLICHREGLIDDGITAYPTLERITHYASVLGNVLRERPAFQAFKAFASFIPGSRYEACHSSSNGLEVHAFSTQHFVMHAVWTINGHAAALSDIYAKSDLTQAICFSRDGELLAKTPDFATESPVYLRWPKGQQITLNDQAALIPNLAIHAHANKTHYLYRQDGWCGALLAENADEASVLGAALNPQHIGAPPKEAILRNARNAIWTIPDPRDPSKKLVVKQPVRMHAHKKLLDRFKPSKGLRSWNGASELLRRGVETARPVAYLEKSTDRSLTQNYYICEYVEADFSMRDIFSAFAQGEESYRGISQQAIYNQLAEYLLAMHGRGVFFRDLSGGNILVSKGNDDRLEFSLIDTARAHFYQRGTVLPKRIADLTRICNKLHAEGRNRFMQIYMDKLGKPFGLRWQLPFHIYNAKVLIKRALKGKALKRLFKR